MTTAINLIDRKIDGIRVEVCRRTLLMNIFSAESWQRAWDRHPELRARENELFRQRGIAQQERDAKAHKEWKQEQARAKRIAKRSLAKRQPPKMCPTCGCHTLFAEAA